MNKIYLTNPLKVMKRTIYLIAVATAICFASCGYDDDDVWNAINNQEERITALENWQKTTSENIAALQAMVNENDYITDVTPIVENGETTGYTISFLKHTSISIYNGSKGDKGEPGNTPLIGVTKQEDGKYYWTLNGELLKDAEGNPICASGQDGEDGADGNNGASGSSAPIPQVEIGKNLSATTDKYGNPVTEDAIYLSVDGGKTWVKVSGDNNSSSTGTGGFIINVVDKGDYYLFECANGTKIEIPQYKGLRLVYLEQDENTNWIKKNITNGEVEATANKDFVIKCYYPQGYKMSYDILNGNENWKITREDRNEFTNLKFKGVNKTDPTTILFSLIAENNSVEHYQVIITIAQNETISKTDDNENLISALTSIGIGTTDSQGNLIITQEEINETTRLELKNKQLTSLEGLDCFVNLTLLNCSQNQLTEIDGSKLPEKLTQLNCSGNKLEKFDISTLKELTYLDCSGCFNTQSRSSFNNGTLDLSNHPNLEYLFCNENGLQTLNIIQTPKLKELSCYDNNLTELDLSKNTMLYYLRCFNNNIIALDLSNNTELLTLQVNSNKIEQLDLSKNTLLQDVSINDNFISKIDLSNHKALDYLSCGRNNLKSLNVNNNPALKILFCDNNQMYTLDISHNLQLEDIQCGNQHNAEGSEQSLVLTVNEEQVSSWENSWQYNNYNVTISDQVIDKLGGNSNDFTNGGIY